MPVPADAADAIDQSAQKAERAGGRNPAIGEAVKIIRRAGEMPIDAALAEERAVFQRLRGGETAAALRHLFFAERAAGRFAGGEHATARPVVEIGVVGGGTMGVGIAICLPMLDSRCSGRAGSSGGQNRDGAAAVDLRTVGLDRTLEQRGYGAAD